MSLGKESLIKDHLLGAHDSTRTIADFDRALQAGTRDVAVTLINRGACRLALGDRAGAAADYREALRRDPGNATAAASLKSLEP